MTATAGTLRRVAPRIGRAVLIVLADQATKLLILARFAHVESLPVTAFFNLILVYNKGAAFSFLAGAAGWQTPLLVTIALGAIAIVSWMLWRNPSRRNCSASASRCKSRSQNAPTV